MKQTATKSHNELRTIHVLAADPGFPSAKSIAGPSAFSRRNIPVDLRTSPSVPKPLLASAKKMNRMSHVAKWLGMSTNIYSLPGDFRKKCG